MNAQANEMGTPTAGHAEQLTAWFGERANALNAGPDRCRMAESLCLLAREGLLGTGVPARLGGEGGSLHDAVEAIAGVAGQCLTSGFVFWCQRAFTELLVATGNPWLRSNVLPKVLSGECSGATGLSNAINHLAGLEPLRLQGVDRDERMTLWGTIPLASNLRPNGFFVAAAARVGPQRSVVIVVPSSAPGLIRGSDLQLLGLQASWTAPVRLEDVELPFEWIVSDDAGAFLSRVKPTFLLLQCGLALGLARRALAEAHSAPAGRGRILGPRVQAAAVDLRRLDATLGSLADGSDPGRLRSIIETRIELTRLAVHAVQLELEAVGSEGYLAASGTGRRLREAAFLPVLTPSLVQLESEVTRIGLPAGVAL